MYQKTCVVCQEEFQSKAHNARVCSKPCRKTLDYEQKARGIANNHKGHINKCIVCEKEFKARIPHKKTCSTECRKVHSKKYHSDLYEQTHDMPERICLHCQVDISHLHKRARYCCEPCRRKAERLRLCPLIKKICVHCEKEFETRSKEARFCSHSCVNHNTKHEPVKKLCPNCKIEFEVDYQSRDRKFFCSRSCATSGEFNAMFGVRGKKNPMYGQKPWTFGKTAATDPALAALGKKISKTLKQYFADGIMSNAGEKNPMYGRNHTIESCNQMSETRSAKIIAGDYPNWCKGKYFSSKLSKEIHYRSSWELKVYKILDKDNLVVTYKTEPLAIPYQFEGKTKHYIPDLLINESHLIEIKPRAFLEYPINQAKFAAAQQYCNQNNLTFEVWTEQELETKSI